MKAMIFAAGLGTRLRPITNNLPKALVKINNKTLLEIAIENLVHNGFDEIIINVHHFAKQIINYIDKNNFEADIQISNESEFLMDTGGGLKKASWFFDDGTPFLLYNVDIMSNFDLNKFYNHSLKSDCIASLVIKNRKSGRYLLFNDDNLLCGWRNVITGQIVNSKQISNLNEFAFSGIHFVKPNIFSLMPDKEKFSMIDLYLQIMDTQNIAGYLDVDSFWLDVGKTKHIKTAESSYNKFIR